MTIIKELFKGKAVHSGVVAFAAENPEVTIIDGNELWWRTHLYDFRLIVYKDVVHGYVYNSNEEDIENPLFRCTAPSILLGAEKLAAFWAAS